MHEKYAIAVLADAKYLEKAKQLFYSAYTFGNWSDDFILLAHEIKTSDLEWFINKNITIINTPPITQNEDDKTPNVFYSKYYLFHPMLNTWEKVIFFDLDMIIRKDINSLKNLNQFSAVADAYLQNIIHQFKDSKRLLSDFKKSSLRKLSFNTGMMVVMTKNNSHASFNQLLALHEKFHLISRYQDQGIINLFMLKKWKRLPYVFNDYFASESHNRRGINKRKDDSNAVVLHIIHPHKPWDKKSEYYSEWKENYQNADEIYNHRQQGEEVTWSDKKIPDWINTLNVFLIKNKDRAIWKLKLYLGLAKENKHGEKN